MEKELNNDYINSYELSISHWLFKSTLSLTLIQFYTAREYNILERL